MVVAIRPKSWTVSSVARELQTTSWHVRVALRRHGLPLEISSNHRRGYRITAETMERLRAVLHEPEIRPLARAKPETPEGHRIVLGEIPQDSQIVIFAHLS